MDLLDYYDEVCKTAGITEDDYEDEKIAAVIATCEQFDLDGIAFNYEDEKIAAALEIVDGFEKEADAIVGGITAAMSDKENAMKHGIIGGAIASGLVGMEYGRQTDRGNSLRGQLIGGLTGAGLGAITGAGGAGLVGLIRR